MSSPLIRFIVAGATLLSSPAFADIIYVDAGATGLDDGTSWEHAFRRLRPALLSARSGDEVRVAQGQYCPAGPGQSRNLSFILPAGASLVGGFAGWGGVDPDAFDPETYITTLTGDVNGDDGSPPDFANYSDNCRHVVIVDGGGRQTVLRGVTVSGGNADGAEVDGVAVGGAGAGIAIINQGAPSILECVLEFNQGARAGAAVHAIDGQPLLRRCVIQDNQTTDAHSMGGACVLAAGSRVERCVFQSNTAGRSGGALVGDGIEFTNTDFIDNAAGEFGGAVVGNSLTFNGCSFTGNQAEHGGAMRCANVTLHNCEFEGNIAQRRGGAILAAGFLTLRECQFTLNLAQSGGAIDVRGVFAASSCVFDRNSTGEDGLDGGAIAAKGLAVAGSCRFLANFAGRSGGAISLDEGVARIVNSSMTGNRARRIGGAIANERASMSVINCAVAGNLSDLVGGKTGGAVHNGAGGSMRVLNSILWSNLAGGLSSQRAQLSHSGASLLIAHSIVQGWNGALGGEGNAGFDPLLTDADGADDQFGTADDDLRLQAGSPARDAGDRTLLPSDELDLDRDGVRNERVPVDLAGVKRIRGGQIDLGPLEF